MHGRRDKTGSPAQGHGDKDVLVQPPPPPQREQEG